MTARVLFRAGFKVIEASSFANAAEACRLQTFDVCVLDSSIEIDLNQAVPQLAERCGGIIVTTASYGGRLQSHWPVLAKPYPGSLLVDSIHLLQT